ncbi:hypothetical protein C1645_783462 [Glomus cerebriforme]|uniref:HMG box domain-containing protein n=1 Tax=Glomus cerebriforme TaxID=658196 RepID=A0A397SL99_9GLOM|nr:hypothetical protein C1645_783462 [Glomus cerebriforme]
MEIFKNYNLDNQPFKHPLQNPFFRYYLVHINQSYDLTKICNDQLYLKNAYDDYFNHLIDECYRPKYPPDIKVEDYVLSFDSPFTVYQRYLMKYLEKLEIRLSLLELSSLACRLWDSEPQEVIFHYKKLSVQLKILYDERLKKLLSNDSQNIEQSSDDYDNTDSVSSNDDKCQCTDSDLDFSTNFFSIQVV